MRPPKIPRRITKKSGSKPSTKLLSELKPSFHKVDVEKADQKRLAAIKLAASESNVVTTASGRKIYFVTSSSVDAKLKSMAESKDSPYCICRSVMMATKCCQQRSATWKCVSKADLKNDGKGQGSVPTCHSCKLYHSKCQFFTHYLYKYSNCLCFVIEKPCTVEKEKAKDEDYEVSSNSSSSSLEMPPLESIPKSSSKKSGLFCKGSDLRGHPGDKDEGFEVEAEAVDPNGSKGRPKPSFSYAAMAKKNSAKKH